MEKNEWQFYKLNTYQVATVSATSPERYSGQIASRNVARDYLPPASSFIGNRTRKYSRWTNKEKKGIHV